MTDPIEAEALVRTFGDVHAVEGVDIVVGEGEIFGFLGRNGAGKSTTVRMLTTLLKPTGGHARVAGYDVVKQAPMVRRSIGVALQDAAIDPLMTGTELMRLQAVLHGIPRAAAEFVIGERREEEARTRQVRELNGRDGSATRRLLPRLERMHDLARRGHVLDPGELDPLDVTDDRDLHVSHLEPRLRFIRR